MKQLTMTKVLTPLAALAFAFGVQAAAVSTSGFETSEGYTANASPTNNASAGWSFTPGSDGADDESAVTTYTSAGIATPATCPDGTTAGSNFLKLSTEDGMLFRNMDGTADGNNVLLNNGLYVDTDVQFTITDHSDQPEVTADDKFIIWLEDNNGSTNLCAWAGRYDASGALSSNVFALADSDTSAPITIAPNTWHRLTVKAIANINAGGSATIPGFQVYVDGHLFKTDDVVVDNGYVGSLTQDAQALVGDMTFLPAMTSMAYLSKVGFSGEGAIDNVVVTKEEPGFNGPLSLTFAWADDAPITSVALTSLDLTLTSTGTVRVANSLVNQTLDLVINGTNLGNYDVTIDGTPVANPAAASIVVQNKTYTIGLIAKDTVPVTFTLDSTWDDLISENKITSVKVGDLEVLMDYIALGVPVPLKFPTNVIVTVTSDPVSGVDCTSESANITASGSSVAVTAFASAAAVTISRANPVATVDGVGYSSFADALAAAKTAGTATIALAGNATLTEAAAVGATDNITIDLAGNDITGAADAAVFTVAAGGTLTITNSTTPGIGHVLTNGAATACISNAGTLNLQGGKFAGPVSGGTINVTGGFYTDNISGAVLPAGQVLAQTLQSDEYVWTLVTDSWTARLGATVDGAYTIDDAADLLALQSGVLAELATSGVTFKQTANIDMTGVEGFWGIGWFTSSDSKDASITASGDIPFAGTYDGQGYTISNVTIVRHNYAGVFNNVSGTVRNLTVQNLDFSGTCSEWGCAIVGNAASGSLLENLTAAASTVWGDNANHNVAGVVVRPIGAATIRGCVNNANITASGKRVGGVAAFVGSGSTGTVFDSCTNTAAIVSSNGTRGVGGILGCAEGNTTETATYIRNCVDFGSETAQASGGHAGAIVGSNWNGSYTYTDDGGNTFKASTGDCGYIKNPVFGRAYATASTIDAVDYLTTVKTNDLALGGTYVLLEGLTPTFEFTAAGTIAFDESLTNAAAGAWAVTVADGSGLTLTSAKVGNVTTYTAASAAADWKDSTTVSNQTAAVAYPALEGSALASADAVELTEWATAKSINYADVVAAPGTYVEAFLLNCAVADVATEKAAFKANITVNADGTVTVTPTDGKDYNGTLKLMGATSLTGSWTETNTTTGYNFFKYELSL